MPSEFVPLVPEVPRAAADSDFRVRILPQAHATPAFVPAAIPEPKPHLEPSSHQPTLHLRREGDRITGIQVRCGCGEIIELTCQY